MTTLEASRPAAPYRRVAAQARFEATIVLRNGEQLLVTVILPALALIGLTVASVPDLGAGRRIDIVAPGAIALAIMSSAFTGQAIQTGFDRRYGVLRLLGTTPLGRGGLLAGKVVAVLGIELLQVLVLGALALGLGWRPHWSGAAFAVLIVVLGTAAFVAWALLIAGTLRAEAVLPIANLVWVLLLGAGAVVVPASTMPTVMAEIARFLPSGALGEGLRSALGAGVFDGHAAVVLLAWALAGGAATARLFRWN